MLPVPSTHRNRAVLSRLSAINSALAPHLERWGRDSKPANHRESCAELEAARGASGAGVSPVRIETHGRDAARATIRFTAPAGPHFSNPPPARPPTRLPGGGRFNTPRS